MKTRRVISAILCVFFVCLCGCTSILETERTLVTPHEDMNLSVPDDLALTPEVSDYTELLDVSRGLLIRGQTSGRVIVHEYYGDLETDVAVVKNDLLFRDALGSYALSDVIIVVTPIVSYTDIQIELFYRRSTEQISSIITISTERYLRMELLSMMSDYRESAAILTSLNNITEESVLNYLSELYYDNPLEVVMLPITSIEVYPPEISQSRERLIELNFAYSQPRSVLTAFSGWIKSAARDVAESASGENDAEILLSLCKALSELSAYDSALGSLSEYSTQNIKATAYGALQNGSAIGEGYAMAFKALCGSLNLPCYVVLGERDGLSYAWNIVSYDGSYYHIDPALCDEIGMSGGFFKNDSDMSERYTWNRTKYPICAGLLTYEDIEASEVPEENEPANAVEGDSEAEGALI